VSYGATRQYSKGLFLMDPQHLIFHSDPGHGWLQVRRADLIRFGIADQISTCSYIDQRREYVYLEEDCDAARYLEALRSRGIAYTVTDVNYNTDAPMRAMNHFRPIASPINRGQQPLAGV
jgi:hypothetical protein